MKSCTRCDTAKPEEDFAWRSKKDGKRRYICKGCINAYARNYRENNRERVNANQRRRYIESYRDKALVYNRNYYRNLDEETKRTRAYQSWVRKLRRHYDLSPEDYETLLEGQNGVCAICGRDEDPSAFVTRLTVDHCHDTGKVRGLLCGPCNRAIGLFNDDASVIERAAAYLARLMNGSMK